MYFAFPPGMNAYYEWEKDVKFLPKNPFLVSYFSNSNLSTKFMQYDVSLNTILQFMGLNLLTQKTILVKYFKEAKITYSQK